MGEVHLADFARTGAGEGAFLVTEQFVFDEAFGNRRAVERDEWLFAAVGEVMNRARENNSFPVPWKLSPSRSAVESVAATRWTCWLNSRMDECSPTIRGKP